MSSSNQLKELIKKYGFNEIKNDFKWLEESNKEVREIIQKEENTKNLKMKLNPNPKK